MTAPLPGRVADLDPVPALERPDLLAAPVVAALRALPADVAAQVLVVGIDPTLADTAAFNEAYALDPADGANCVVVTGRRGETQRHAACVVLSSTRLDVNTVVRKRLDARKASFADTAYATGESGMEHGGITPVGLPTAWALLVDAAVLDRPWVIIGSGVRRSKLVAPGRLVAEMPGAEVVDGLARPLAAQ